MRVTKLLDPYGAQPADDFERELWQARWQYVRDQYTEMAECSTDWSSLGRATVRYCAVMDLWYDTYAIKPVDDSLKWDNRRKSK